MTQDDFEWDTGKAEANRVKHGVSFAQAQLVFTDPFGVERLDDRADHGEQRFILTGLADGRLLTVVYTPRGERTRIISARSASARERKDYLESDED